MSFYFSSFSNLSSICIRMAMSYHPSALQPQPDSQSSPGDLGVAEGQRDGKFSQNGKLGHSC